MKSYFGLPEEVKFCKKCVISNQRPSSTVEFKSNSTDKKDGIEFNQDGVCSACMYSKIKNDLDWQSREKKLLKLLERFRSNNGSYDVIVPGSGGKDSSYTAHILKYKYGMNPLTVTWAPHLYTDIGFKNLQNWSHKGGLDNLLYTPNGILHRKMTRNAFLNLLHPFQPFIIGQRIIGPSFASKFGVKLVMYGENQAEYGNAISDNNKPSMNSKYFSGDNFLDLKFGDVEVKKYLREGFTLNDFKPYLPLDHNELSEKNIEVHYLGYYKKWDPQECFYYAVENCGFQSNPHRTEGTYSKYSSIDDKIDPFHYYTTLIKFGLGRCSYDASQEVRNDKITREEAIYLVKKYYQEFPGRFFQEFIEYISISEDLFWKTIDKFRSPHLWKKSNGKWELRKQLI